MGDLILLGKKEKGADQPFNTCPVCKSRTIEEFEYSIDFTKEREIALAATCLNCKTSYHKYIKFGEMWRIN